MSTTIPEMTKVAWSRYDEIAAQAPGMTREQFLFGSRAAGENSCGAPSISARISGTNSVLRSSHRSESRTVQNAGLQTADAGGRTVVPRKLHVNGSALIAFVDAASRHRLRLENRNFDTGRPVKAGDYRLADEAYPPARQARRRRFQGCERALRGDILAFYATPVASGSKKSERKHLQKIREDLDELRRTGSQ